MRMKYTTTDYGHWFEIPNSVLLETPLYIPSIYIPSIKGSCMTEENHFINCRNTAAISCTMFLSESSGGSAIFPSTILHRKGKHMSLRLIALFARVSGF